MYILSTNTPFINKLGVTIKLFLLFLFLMFSNQSLACPSLVGTWQSSKDLSMEYNLKYAGFNEKIIKIKEQIYGILKLTYTNESIHAHGAPTQKITVEGKVFEIKFEDLTFDYQVLNCSNDMVTTKEFYPYGEPLVESKYFIDDDTYWVSPEGKKEREYFVRIQ